MRERSADEHEAGCCLGRLSRADTHTISRGWQVPQGAPDKILGIAQAFKNDPSPSKVNLVIGAYRDGNGSPWVLPSVRAAEKRLLERNAYKEYAGITVYIA